MSVLERPRAHVPVATATQAYATGTGWLAAGLAFIAVGLPVVALLGPLASGLVDYRVSETLRNKVFRPLFHPEPR